MRASSASASRSRIVDSVQAFPLGSFLHLDGEEHYRIAGYHRMAPFLMSLPSESDLWMFVASGGGLTAGRVDPDGALFPYLTVDRLHDAHHHTGPLTLIRARRGGGTPALWEPFSESTQRNPAVQRNLYKNATGNRVVFEEIHRDLGLAFRYSWSACDEFGWVRGCTLENRGSQPLRIELLDGLRNLLPFGASLGLYQQSSNLVDAYKKNELDPDTRLGIFSLTAGITDRAEALESLRANTVCCVGLEDFEAHLSLDAVAAFRRGEELPSDGTLNGARGNYLVSSVLELEPESEVRWRLMADAGLDQLRVTALRRRLREDQGLDARVEDALRHATESLRRTVASADGLQWTQDAESRVHHFANVLYNNMRGGVFVKGHQVPRADLAEFLELRNRDAARRQKDLLASLPEWVDADALRRKAEASGDADFQRLCMEYLPLTFGRRHGDPSRPWNRFSIRARDDEGARVLHYEGNWRDIFQNWEALSRSFPAFLPHFVAKFVNASTVDGFNPYRISSEGVDWEVASPEDPWSNIGYWGDHQIVYLLRLLKNLDRHYPGRIGELLDREIFSYAEVPYIIRPYEEILEDPRSTIDFDAGRDRRIRERAEDEGTDGRLLHDDEGRVLHVNLLEKLLVPALSKLSNLVPDAGIWMNTQRPEWNDANNALGGGGVSFVTLAHLRRYLIFMAEVLEAQADRGLRISAEVADWFEGIRAVLDSERGLLEGEGADAADRKRFMDSLGRVFSDYRGRVYGGGLAGRRELSLAEVAAFCRLALGYVDRGIRANRREDGLYHSYNLLDFSPDGGRVEVVHLEEMLEGQVAVLNSDLLDPEQSLEILKRLYESALYRPEQRSFQLYPEKKLPGFLEKNRLPADRVAGIGLLRELLEEGNASLVARDADGVHRFHGSFRNARDLSAALDRMSRQERWAEAVARDRQAVLDLFEDVFHHHSYLGRSGVMVGYEGLGCIYWHMVAKLLLAVQEVIRRAAEEDRPAELRRELVAYYYRIRSGLGFEKTVAEYGAFPTDPYSHTPPSGGAKQPGMTGHVKEAILARLGELGLRVEKGSLRFRPLLLSPDEYLERPAEFRYFDVHGEERSIMVSLNSLAFTICQVPVIYERVAGEARILAILDDGSVVERKGDTLDSRRSGELFARSGRVREIRVEIPG